jgi:hypothetical protein
LSFHPGFASATYPQTRMMRRVSDTTSTARRPGRKWMQQKREPGYCLILFLSG